MLSPRRQRVLAALIQEYVLHALPVGSRTLMERYDLGVSSATIRNELSYLEELGFIASPHTSAGRVPTDQGYRAFVDRLLEEELSDESQIDASLIEEIRSNARELDDLVDRTSEVLARLTDCLTVVMPPLSHEERIKHISLVQLDQEHVSLIVIMQDGHVHNRMVEYHFAVSDEDLACLESIMNEMFANNTLASAVGQHALPLCDQDLQPLLREFIDALMLCLSEQSTVRPRKVGLGGLISKPEFSNASDLIPIVESMEDNTVLMELFDPLKESTGTSVSIGHENMHRAFEGVSVVASKFGQANNEGVVAVIGPTRMDYTQVIYAVRSARQALDS